MQMTYFARLHKIQGRRTRGTSGTKGTFFSVFLVRGKFERIESIHFAEIPGLSC
jgi:hypothetical protein